MRLEQWREEGIICCQWSKRLSVVQEAAVSAEGQSPALSRVLKGQLLPSPPHLPPRLLGKRWAQGPGQHLCWIPALPFHYATWTCLSPSEPQSITITEVMLRHSLSTVLGEDKGRRWVSKLGPSPKGRECWLPGHQAPVALSGRGRGSRETLVLWQGLPPSWLACPSQTGTGAPCCPAIQG